jgi:hypothetical protein
VSRFSAGGVLRGHYTKPAHGLTQRGRRMYSAGVAWPSPTVFAA